MKFNHRNGTDKRQWNIKQTLWYLFGTLSTQGGDIDHIKKTASRIAVGLWLLCSSVLVYSYSGILVSFLSAPVQLPLPTTFPELANAVKAGKLSCGGYNRGGVNKFIRESKDGWRKIIKDHILENGNFLDGDDEVIFRLKQGKFAFICDIYRITKMRKRIRGKWYISDDVLGTFSVGYVVRRTFPDRKNMNKLIIRIIESGINDVTFPRNRIPDDVTESEGKPLTLENFYGHFFVLSIGYLLALISFIIEKVVGKFKKSNSLHSENQSTVHPATLIPLN
ncbi:uncharacterized protein LOC111612512 [Centruroides sculpturatus]|uniref:uncharacterized protein LOC111612512 n=1 Tax=Centruroides sculpturatus TaxID=218467 RepID=UPI000C6CB47F|nr:uncharacterized protein LOC111612512 [Centruroides sculpturatus]